MILIHRLRAFLRWVFHRHAIEEELSNELQDFIERSTAEKVAMEYHRRKRVDSHGSSWEVWLRCKRRSARLEVWSGLDGFGLDVKLGLRMLARALST